MALTIDKTGNPIRVTGTTDTDAEIYAPSNALAFVREVSVWGFTSQGHKAVFKDEHGKYIAELIASAANANETQRVYSAYQSIHCDDLDSGTVLIYLGR